jgi:nitrogen regulatory protein PII
MVDTARARLVTIVVSSEFAERVSGALGPLGAGGYTQVQVSGRGAHGPRTISAFDRGNVRIETIVRKEVADRILEHVARDFAGYEIIAFAQDVDAVPKAQFT